MKTRIIGSKQTRYRYRQSRCRKIGQTRHKQSQYKGSGQTACTGRVDAEKADKQSINKADIEEADKFQAQVKQT